MNEENGPDDPAEDDRLMDIAGIRAVLDAAKGKEVVDAE